jgi:hypothetical protein
MKIVTTVEFIGVVMLLLVAMMKMLISLRPYMSSQQREMLTGFGVRLRRVQNRANKTVEQNSAEFIKNAMNKLRPTETGKPTIRVSVHGKNWNVNENFWRGVRNGYKYNFERRTWVTRTNRPRRKNNNNKSN